ncbi:MAG: amidohydrolase family protein [Pseudomonadota bacterium]
MNQNVSTSSAADIVYRGGRFYTVDADTPTAEAVAIKNGKFVFAGTNADVAAFIADDTHVVDLDDAFVMPALYDIHIHAMQGQLSEMFEVGFSPMSTVEEIAVAVQRFIERSDEQWVQGGSFGVDLINTYKGRPVREVLDEVSGDRPVFLRDMSMHTAMLNSKALELLGITRDSEAVEGGYIFRDEDGEPNGFISEQQITAAQGQIPLRSEAELDAIFDALQKRMLRYGFVGWREAFLQQYEMETYSRNERAGRLTARVSATMAYPFEGDGIEAVLANSTALSGELFKIDGAKAFADGIMPSYTSLMVEPYNDPSAHGRGPDWKGEPFLSAEALGEAMANLNENGMFLKVHASADGAHRLVLDAAEIAHNRTGSTGARNEAAHAILVHPEDRDRYARLNVAAEISPSMWYPSEIHLGGIRDIGMERTHQQFPTRALIDAGAMGTAGSDWPVGEPNPWPGIEALITRQDPYRSTDHLGMPYLSEDQAITLDEALQIYTRNNADQMGHKDDWGTITVGKSADLVVLNHDLREIDPKEISETFVLQTMLAGEVVHELTEAEIVAERSKAVSAAFRKKSIDQMRDLYAEDVRIITSGNPAVHGQEAAMGFFAEIFASPAEQLIMNIDKVEVDGNMAVEVGSYVVALPDRSPMDMGNYLVNWRKDSDGTWRVVNDVIVTTVPFS